MDYLESSCSSGGLALRIVSQVLISLVCLEAAQLAVEKKQKHFDYLFKQIIDC